MFCFFLYHKCPFNTDIVYIWHLLHCNKEGLKWDFGDQSNADSVFLHRLFIQNTTQISPQKYKICLFIQAVYFWNFICQENLKQRWEWIKKLLKQRPHHPSSLFLTFPSFTISVQTDSLLRLIVVEQLTISGAMYIGVPTYVSRLPRLNNLESPKNIYKPSSCFH